MARHDGGRAVQPEAALRLEVLFVVLPVAPIPADACKCPTLVDVDRASVAERRLLEPELSFTFFSDSKIFKQGSDLQGARSVNSGAKMWS